VDFNITKHYEQWPVRAYSQWNAAGVDNKVPSAASDGSSDVLHSFTGRGTKMPRASGGSRGRFRMPQVSYRAASCD
jgi:hypothetical protein